MFGGRVMRLKLSVNVRFFSLRTITPGLSDFKFLIILGAPLGNFFILKNLLSPYYAGLKHTKSKAKAHVNKAFK